MNRLTLSKGELLSWVNSRTKQHGLSANRIDQLGNGAAFLLLLNEMYPGSVRVNKILLSATLDYQNHQNLKMLSVAFGNLGIPYNIQIAKLANMKYQDCLNLLQFMYKLWRQKVAEAAAMGKEVATKQAVTKQAVTKQAVTKNQLQQGQTESGKDKQLLSVKVSQTRANRKQISSHRSGKTMIDDARVAFEIKHLRDTPERQVELVQSVFKEALDDKRKLLKIKNILFGNSDATEDKLEAEDNLEADDKLETEEKLEIEEHQLQAQPTKKIETLEEKFLRISRKSLARNSKFLNSKIGTYPDLFEETEESLKQKKAFYSRFDLEYPEKEAGKKQEQNKEGDQLEKRQKQITRESIDSEALLLSHAKNQGSHSKIRHLAGNEAAEDMVNNAMLLSNSKQVACSEKERIKELPLDHLLQTGKSNLESAHSETTRCDAGSSHSLEVADASGTTHSAKIPDDLVPGQNIQSTQCVEITLSTCCAETINEEDSLVTNVDNVDV